MGFFALNDIQNGAELYLDYVNAEMFDLSAPVDWMYKPPPINPLLSKGYYENQMNPLYSIILGYLSKKRVILHRNFYERL